MGEVFVVKCEIHLDGPFFSTQEHKKRKGRRTLWRAEAQSMWEEHGSFLPWTREESFLSSWLSFPLQGREQTFILAGTHGAVRNGLATDTLLELLPLGTQRVHPPVWAEACTPALL